MLRDMQALLPDCTLRWYDELNNRWLRTLSAGRGRAVRMQTGVVLADSGDAADPGRRRRSPRLMSADHRPMMIAFVRYLSAGLIASLVARGTGRASWSPAATGSARWCAPR